MQFASVDDNNSFWHGRAPTKAFMIALSVSVSLMNASIRISNEGNRLCLICWLSKEIEVDNWEMDLQRHSPRTWT
jgi:hypothetical protein